MYIEFLYPHWAFFLMNWHSAAHKTPLPEGEILWRNFEDTERQLRFRSSKHTCILWRKHCLICNKDFPNLLLKYHSVVSPIFCLLEVQHLLAVLNTLSNKRALSTSAVYAQGSLFRKVKTPSLNKIAGIQKEFFPNSAQTQERTGWSPSPKHEARLETW